ncbi:MAG: hypothetical protein ABW151_15120 [Pseudorhodoplanes sp.]
MTSTAELDWTPPPLPEKTYLFGPVARRLQRRTLMFWLLLCCLGAIPNLLATTTHLDIPLAWCVFGWGLWLPGAGFLAIGGWATLLFPLALALFVVAFWIWVLCGMVIAPPVVWTIAAFAAPTMTTDRIAPATWIMVPLLVILLYVLHRYLLKRNYKAAIQLSKKREAGLPGWLAELDRVQSPVTDASDPTRELTPDELGGLRYILDRALQPVGMFEGFTRIDNFQLAGLRYQLNYMSYGLSMLQRKYLPNFHGYLNHAQRYAIESLTSPEVCGYWKYENFWGNLSLNPDPISTKDDVMLTGLSLPALSCYAENTGDRRYEQKDALQFRPCKLSSKTYGQNARSFVDSIVWNWKRSIYFLYPCEPHWVFPICNSYAMCGVKPFDRTNGTRFAADAYPSFMRMLDSEFVAPGGSLQPELSALIGISPFWNVTQMQMDNLLSVSQVFNGLHPGYAKLWYVCGRHEYLKLTPEGLELTHGSWSDCTDFGNYQKNPGMALGTIALAAREHGDDVIAEAALRKAAELLTPLDDKGVLAYQDISNTANINLAVARWARREDWLDTINRAPLPGASTGPILTGCVYPDVLVARAFSDGATLDLVLYNGREPGQYALQIERLQAGRAYRVDGAAPSSFTASTDGTITLNVALNGRKSVTLTPQAAAND